MLQWLLEKLWEKINIPQVYQGIKSLGIKYGRRFFWAALIWEGVEDIVFPFMAWLSGVPELIPIFLILHFEPIVYPVFFWVFRMWDRWHGREPWEPERSAQSSHWRSLIKVVIFQLSVLGWLSQVIAWKPLAIFTALVSLFGFVHERIWHDSNFGIAPNDDVQLKRIVGKTGTYLLVSTITLYPFLKVFGIGFLVWTLCLAQTITGMVYLLLEIVWAKSMLGVSSVSKNH